MYQGRLSSHRFVDISGTTEYPIAAFQCVSLLTSAQITTFSGTQGTSVRVSPTQSSPADRDQRVFGTTVASAKHNTQVSVQKSGYAQVMCGAAVAYASLLFNIAPTTGTSLVAPILNLPEAWLPGDPTVTQTYHLGMVDDTAVTPSTTGNTIIYSPVGYALTAGAQYQIIPVELDLSQFYA